MSSKAGSIIKTITLERHNKTVMRLVEQHNEELQLLKDKIEKLEREARIGKSK
jgi:hypothetical protein